MTTARLSCIIAVAAFVVACRQSAPKDHVPPSRAEVLYNRNCKACHGTDGKRGFDGAFDLSQSVLTLQETIQVISEGRGRMVGYGRVIVQEDIESLAEYIASFK